MATVETHDPDFLPLGQKGARPERELPPSRLAVLSLVMGIVGLFVPLMSIVAIVSGHTALSSIRRAGGQVGGRSLAIVGLTLGYLWMIMVALIVGLVMTWTLRSETATSDVAAVWSTGQGPRWDFSAKPGVKMANEVTPSYVDWLRENRLVSPSNPIVVAYEAPSDLPDGPELAVVTAETVLYVHKHLVTVLPLSDVTEILHGQAFYDRFDPEHEASPDDDLVVGITSRSGQTIRVRVTSGHEATLFANRLEEVWKARQDEDAHGPRLEEHHEADDHAVSPAHVEIHQQGTF